MDEVAEYLRRVSAVKRDKFRHGYATARTGTVAKEDVGRSIDHDALVSPNTSGVVVETPVKRDREDDAIEDNAQKKLRQGDVAVPLSAAKAVIDSALPGLRRVSLIDKWFPGNTLKEATLELAQAPTLEFISNTVSRVTALRERMVTLRGGVDDLEGLLSSVARSMSAPVKANDSVSGNAFVGSRLDQITMIVNKQSWLAFQELFLQAFSIETGSLQSTRRVLHHILRRKPDATCPVHLSSVCRWHEFLNLRGPECAGLPSLSFFAWMSSASTTTLFTVLTQRLLRGVREVAAAGCAQDHVRSNFAQCIADGLDRAEESSSQYDTDDARESVLSGVVNAAEVSDERRDASWLRTCSLQLSDKLTRTQRQLLVFLTFFMPTACDVKSPLSSPQAQANLTRRVSTGFGVWLLACLCALDYPLDPDTDRLVHELFRTCCEQVRVLSEWKGVCGDSRGSLVAAFGSTQEGLNSRPRQYSTLEDISKEDVLALYTIIVILAKFFRQNQNRLIPL